MGVQTQSPLFVVFIKGPDFGSSHIVPLLVMIQENATQTTRLPGLMQEPDLEAPGSASTKATRVQVKSQM